jgi:putative two-component system response regulator
MTDLAAGLQAIFEDNKEDFQRRVATLDEAVAAILAGSLDEDLRSTAERDAHTLVGSLGTFGLSRGSQLARRLEHRFSRPQPSPATHDAQLVELVSALRWELDTLGGLHPREKLDVYSSGVAGATSPADPQPIATMAGQILVVDDDAAVRQVLTQILTHAGYEVRAVGSAEEARRALEGEAIALLLSDVSMPGETGLDLIRFALCEFPGIATLLISALEDPGIAQVAMEFGAYGYLSKPVRPSAVLIGVMNALRRRDMEARERAVRATLEHTVGLRTRALSHALERLEAADQHGRMLQAETIHRWAQAAEHREPGIGRHVKHMSRYCEMLARRFGLHPESIGLASALHDVGKLAIPDRILRKPANLTPDERLVIETHADIGYGMLRDSCSSLLDLAASIARNHHERFDGNGYPRGLAGADIPLEGRIAAVADVFDALTSDRVYRPAWSMATTTEWMAGERGKHFDPAVLDAFLAAPDEILAIRSALTDERRDEPS